MARGKYTSNKKNVNVKKKNEKLSAEGRITDEILVDVRKIEISEFIKYISSKISITDIDIDTGNIDNLIVKLYEDFKIWHRIYLILN